MLDDLGICGSRIFDVYLSEDKSKLMLVDGCDGCFF